MSSLLRNQNNFRKMAIRCSNCGSENPDDKKKCIKCNTPLEKKANTLSNKPEAKPNIARLTGTIPGLQVDDDTTNDVEKNRSPIVLDSTPSDREAERPAIKLGETITCPHCNFLNLAPRKTCIKCQGALDKNSLPEFEIVNIIKEDSLVDTSSSPKLIEGKPLPKTIPPFLAKEEKFKCQFYLNHVSGEKPIENPIKFTCSNLGSIILNRANISPDNYTITSKSQAELSVENGKWSIIDTSELQTTFIKVQMDESFVERPISDSSKPFKKMLSSGEIVLLGTTKFMFNCEEKVALTTTIDPYRRKTCTCSFTELVPQDSTLTEPIHFTVSEGESDHLNYFSFGEKKTATIKRIMGQWSIENNTFFHTRPSEKTLLKNYDLILLGDLEVQFQKVDGFKGNDTEA